METLPNTQNAARELRDSSFVEVVAHDDADGVSTAAIVCKTVLSAGGKYHFTTFDGSSEGKKASTEDAKAVFCDIGAGYLDELPNDALVIDHHPHSESEREGFGGTLVTPRDIGEEASSSCAAYFVARELGLMPASLGVVGALGDNVDMDSGLPARIIEDGVENGTVRRRNGIRLVGDDPVEALAYSTNPYTECTGSFEKARDFVQELGISKPISELSEDELRKFSTAVVSLALKNPNANPETVESIVGEVYEIEDRARDAYTLSRYVGACAKQSKSGLGLALCLGKNSVEEAHEVYRSFQSSLITALDESETEIEGGLSVTRLDTGFDTGSVAEVVSDWMFDGIVLVVNAKGDVSLQTRETDINLGELARVSASEVGGKGGGHLGRAGATIPEDRIDEFVERVKNRVEKL